MDGNNITWPDGSRDHVDTIERVPTSLPQVGGD
jgi:hypothetical protein